MSNYYLTPPLQQTDYHQQTGYHHDLSHSSVQYQMQTTPTRTNEWQKSQETNPRIYVSAVNTAPYSYQQQGLLRQRPVVLAAAAHMPTPSMIHDPAVVRALLLLLDSMYTHCCGAHVNIHVQTHVVKCRLFLYTLLIDLATLQDYSIPPIVNTVSNTAKMPKLQKKTPAQTFPFKLKVALVYIQKS